MRIFVDIDDTIINTVTAWVRWLNADYGLNVKVEDIKEWDMCKAFPMLEKQDVYSPLFDEVFWETVEAFPEAIEVLERLNKKHDVFFVSATHPSNVSNKVLRCVHRFFPYITSKQYIFMYYKSFLDGDIIIDDRPENLIYSKCKYKFLIDKSHNQTFNCRDNDVELAKDWKWIEKRIELIEKLEGEKNDEGSDCN
jgi:5'(3')-deoxyribonucleotidase